MLINPCGPTLDIQRFSYESSSLGRKETIFFSFGKGGLRKSYRLQLSSVLRDKYIKKKAQMLG